METAFLKDGRECFEAVDEGRDGNVVEAESHVERLKGICLF